MAPEHVEAKPLLAKSLASQVKNFWPYIGLDAGVAKTEEVAALSAALRDSHVADDDPRLHAVLRRVAQPRGDFAAALREFRIRLDQQPKSVDAHIELASAYYRQSDPAPARELLLHALALAARFPTDALMANWLLIEFMAGDYDAVIEWGERLQAANPGWAVRFASLALAYAMKGQREKAAAAASSRPTRGGRFRRRFGCSTNRWRRCTGRIGLEYCVRDTGDAAGGVSAAAAGPAGPRPVGARGPTAHRQRGVATSSRPRLWTYITRWDTVAPLKNACSAPIRSGGC